MQLQQPELRVASVGDEDDGGELENTCLKLSQQPSRWTIPMVFGRRWTTTALSYVTHFGPGRPWRPIMRLQSFLPSTMYPHLILLFLCASTVFRIAECCSSRSTPKPRPTSPTTRPNITFQTYACPEAYAKWYCLNGATCFAVKIRDSILYNCECADGYMGQRCEFKDLDGSYLPSRERVMIETASIAGGLTIAVLLVALISLTFYIHTRRRWRRQKRYHPCYPELVKSKGYLIQTSSLQYHLYPYFPPTDLEMGRSARESNCHPPGRIKSSIATISVGNIP